MALSVDVIPETSNLPRWPEVVRYWQAIMEDSVLRHDPGLREMTGNPLTDLWVQHELKADRHYYPDVPARIGFTIRDRDNDRYFDIDDALSDFEDPSCPVNAQAVRDAYGKSRLRWIVSMDGARPSVEERLFIGLTAAIADATSGFVLMYEAPNTVVMERAIYPWRHFDSIVRGCFGR